MSPVTHFLAGWLLANTPPRDRRERAAVVVAAVVPGIDGLNSNFSDETRIKEYLLGTLPEPAWGEIEEKLSFP